MPTLTSVTWINDKHYFTKRGVHICTQRRVHQQKSIDSHQPSTLWTHSCRLLLLISVHVVYRFKIILYKFDSRCKQTLYFNFWDWPDTFPYSLLNGISSINDNCLACYAFGIFTCQKDGIVCDFFYS